LNIFKEISWKESGSEAEDDGELDSFEDLGRGVSFQGFSSFTRVSS